jgi:hypothetical protein
VLTRKVAITLEAGHAVEIIEEAFARFGLQGIANTDQGRQFTVIDFTGAVLNKGCTLSMDGRGAGVTTSLSSAFGAAPGTSGSTSRHMTAWPQPVLTLQVTSTGTTLKDRIPVWIESRLNRPV